MTGAGSVVGTTVLGTSVVVSNLAYLGGALVMIVLLSTVLVLRQRKPKSVDANVESFNRGLRALAPSAPVAAPERRRSVGGTGGVSRAGSPVQILTGTTAPADSEADPG
jgi:hypothetical protein